MICQNVAKIVMLIQATKHFGQILATVHPALSTLNQYGLCEQTKVPAHTHGYELGYSFSVKHD